jgi:hypothetical protein
MTAAKSLPSHLAPITVDIPATWTAEEALAVFELLEEITQRIRGRYGTRMQDLLREPNQTPTHDATEGAPDVV